MRRKLAWYNLSLIIGILFGYIFFEKNEMIYAIFLFFIVLICLNILFDIEVAKAGELKNCIAFILIGIVLISSSFLHFYNLYDRLQKEDDIKIKAFVKDIEIKDDRLSFVISEGRGINSICNVYYKGRSKNNGKNKGKEIPEKIKVGDEVIIGGKRKIPEVSRNPEMFNYRLYLKSKKIVSIINVKSIAIDGINKDTIWIFRRKLYCKKSELISKFCDPYNDKNIDAGGFIQGILFGDTSLLDEDIYDEFRKNGTAHVLAVSGLHIGFIISMLRFLSKSKKTVTVTIFIILVLIFYGELTGWNISTIRSVVITIMALMAFYFKRHFDLLSAVSMTSILILAFNPYYLFNSGFQMSFIAMLGITFLNSSIGKMIGGKLGGLIGIQILMSSYCAFVFNIFNPMSIIINIPIVFIISLIVPLGLILISINIIFGIWSGFIIKIMAYLSRLTMSLNHFLYFEGSTSLNINSRGFAFFSLSLAIIIFIFSEQFKIWIIRRDIKRIFISFLTLIFFVSALCVPFKNNFARDEVVFLDVGQGDAIHVRTVNKLIKKKNIMFDGGGSRDYNVGEKILKPYLLKNGASKLDFVFISHLHEDHFKGIKELSEDMAIEKLFLDRFYNDGKTKSPNNIYSRRKEYIEIGDVIRVNKDIRITVLWPQPSDFKANEIRKAEGENDKNMVLMLQYKKIKIMITGDLTGEDEGKMLEYYKKNYGSYGLLHCDILKVSHHGSRYSNSEEFLKVVRPRAAVIQAGKNNIYGHPHRETIRRLENLGIDIYRTDQSGAIGVDISGSDNFRIDKMINN